MAYFFEAAVDRTTMRPDVEPPWTPASAARAWSGLIEAMLDAVWLVDVRTLAIVAANRAAGHLMALAPHELVGKTMLELAATPEDLCFWGEAADGLADRIESDTLIARGDGGVVPVTRRVSRITLDGEALYVVTLRDRSEQVRIERELEGTAADLRATLESTQDGILVTDLAGRIRNFNQRFAALWQIPNNLLLQRDDDAVLEWMRRSVTDPVDLHAAPGGDGRRDDAAGQRRGAPALGHGDRARDDAAVHAQAARSAACSRSATSPTSSRPSAASRRCRTPTR